MSFCFRRSSSLDVRSIVVDESTDRQLVQGDDDNEDDEIIEVALLNCMQYMREKLTHIRAYTPVE